MFEKVEWTYEEEETNGINPVVRSWVTNKLDFRDNVKFEIKVYELLSGDIFMFISQDGRVADFYPSNDQEILVIANCITHIA